MRPYKTVHIEAKTERVINRSRFISQCFPVKTEEEALLRLSEVKKQYPDATHVCYAYRIGENSETTRFSDAGEPSGTAGMPILEVLKAKGLHMFCVQLHAILAAYCSALGDWSGLILQARLTLPPQQERICIFRACSSR